MHPQVQNNATHGKQGLGRSDAPKKVSGARWEGTKKKLGSSSEEEEEEEEASKEEEEEEPVGVVVVMSKAEQQQQQAEVATAGAGKEKKSKGARKKKKREALAEAAGEEVQAPGREEDKKEKKRKGKKRSSGVEEPEGGGPGGGSECGTGPTASTAPEGSGLVVSGSRRRGPPGSREGKVGWRKIAKRLLSGAPKRRLRVRLLTQQALAHAGVEAVAGSGEYEGAAEGLMGRIRGCGLFEVGDKYVRLLKV